MRKQREELDRGTELVEAYRGGDLSLREFSERLRKKQRLLPVVVTVKPEESAVAEMVVVAGNRRRVELRQGFDPELLLRALSVLERA